MRLAGITGVLLPFAAAGADFAFNVADVPSLLSCLSALFACIA
jgi:hypothetical protein